MQTGTKAAVVSMYNSTEGPSVIAKRVSHGEYYLAIQDTKGQVHTFTVHKGTLRALLLHAPYDYFGDVIAIHRSKVRREQYRKLVRRVRRPPWYVRWLTWFVVK